ncbi:MAG: hypothetical protein JRG83_18185, partial [Deltaproteobacteria bacterium]|nr:hypothetical protein [Deltaproteobacteria bacterium]
MSHARIAESPPFVGNSGFRLGSLLVSLMDAAPGQERSFNRWYDRDHFHAGCMAGPGFFAGRRFLATRELRALRSADAPPFLDDAQAGAFLALYFIAAGQHESTEAWAVERVNALRGAGRMHPDRRPVHAGFYQQAFAVKRDPDGVPPELALDHPFEGVVLATYEAAREDATADLEAALVECLAGAMDGSGVALALGFRPVPLPDDAPEYVARPPGLAGRRLVLGLYNGVPRDACDVLASGA